ncbi:protein of unknown function [Candidatus Methylomirabilis oxygeniifera]|uniref:Uncharacterized protein n=1 Tax=Methylomirabilis oxygeniifera TaxID=671143 RepID=D5MH29_METO1|nr:protein of unknown function [Candidatus Methylomirabilis oxyfera]
MIDMMPRPSRGDTPRDRLVLSVPPPGGFGSPVVRTTAATRDIILQLEDTIIRTAKPWNREDVLIHHTSMTAYTMLAVFHLGIRPRNTPHIGGADLTGATAHWVIQDKSSKIYFEERLLYVPPVVVHLVQQLGTFRGRLEREILNHLGSSAIARLPADPLFFFDTTGSVVPFSLKAFWAALCALPIGFPADTPRNFGRHWLRTRLAEDGVADDLMNMWFGHTAAGREPLANHASTCYGPALAQLRDRIAEYLRELGFKHLEYFRPTTRRRFL